PPPRGESSRSEGVKQDTPPLEPPPRGESSRSEGVKQDTPPPRGESSRSERVQQDFITEPLPGGVEMLRLLPTDAGSH
ncbi:unnamed protein product, partial [Gadus morhua 'NCC']